MEPAGVGDAVHARAAMQGSQTVGSVLEGRFRCWAWRPRGRGRDREDGVCVWGVFPRDLA